MDWLSTVTMEGIGFLSTLFLFMIGIAVLATVVLFVIDVSQTQDAVRRNYPVIGRFRELFSTLGEFFRQYFFAMDREEMPFNRAERDWVTKSAKGKDNTVAFGSTKNLNAVETTIFVNCPFPIQEDEAEPEPRVVIGPHADVPYETASLYNISGMSYGAISKPAVQALSRGAAKAGCWINTGEGGLSPYHLESGADVVFQIGTAKYGVRTQNGGLDAGKLKELAMRPEVRMIELKMSQGAKPGKGGILPGVKVTPDIANVRGIPVGADSISPNGHPEIDNVVELVDYIDMLKEVSGKPVGFKAVIGAYGWLDTLWNEVAKRGAAHGPDFITVDSGDGGTGAAPMSLMDNVGLPIRESLPLVIDSLVRAGLRDRVKVVASGKLITPAEVAWAYAAGTDFVVSARGFMFALGCIQSLKCNKNTCPTGITTHNPRFQRGLDPADKAVRVANFVEKITYGTRLIAHSCGAKSVRGLKRYHCRVVLENGRSVPFDELYPNAAPMQPGDVESVSVAGIEQQARAPQIGV
ncbi:MAG: FMN-binding glutamate synthase family protein [Pseudomonadota bacterium]